MRISRPPETDSVSTFGQRRVAPRVCIVDPKRHIRTFLGDALEELGFIGCECATASELPTLLDLHVPDLVVLGMPSDGTEAGNILKALVENNFRGGVLLIGPKDSIIVNAVRELGEEIGIAMLAPLATPHPPSRTRLRQ